MNVIRYTGQGNFVLTINNLPSCSIALLDLTSYENKSIAILGYGIEGRATIRFFQQYCPHASLFICDADPMITHARIPCFVGDAYLDGLAQAHIIFKSPGISPHLPELSPYVHKFTSQMQLFLDMYPGKIIGITGTKGKTTLSHLAYETLKQAGYTTALAGNVGYSVFNTIDIEQPVDRLVLELSSYQLYNLSGTIDIAIYNNFYHEHHIARHGSFEAYKADKSHILDLATYALVGSQLVQEHPDIRKHREKKISYDVYGNTGTYTYDDHVRYVREKKVMDDNTVLLPGEHNKYNISAILGLCDKLHISIDIFCNVLKNFSGVEHRLELVGDHHGLTWINDAIATTPESTIAALDTYKTSINTIFLGGKDGGYDFKELVSRLHMYHIAHIVLFPDNGYLIEEEIHRHAHYQPDIVHCTTMHDAVQYAKRYTHPNSIVLLSCASPSYSLWKNFEEKGREFKEAIKHSYEEDTSTARTTHQ